MFTRFLALLACTLIGLGCDDATEGDDATDDTVAPTVSIDNLTDFAPISGTVEVQLTVVEEGSLVSLELRLDGAAVATSDGTSSTLSFDASGLAAGQVLALSAVATDAAGNVGTSTALNVVAVEGGTRATLAEGETGEIAIPEELSLTSEVDERHHLTTDEDGFARLIAIVRTQPAEGAEPWAIELAGGTGFCPDSGTTIGEPVVLAGPSGVLDLAPDGGFPGTTQLFVHLKPIDAADHLGETLPYEVAVFTFDAI